jgi:hypothetical protein
MQTKNFARAVMWYGCANVLASRSQAQHFVNKVQQIVNFAARQDGSKATKNA